MNKPAPDPLSLAALEVLSIVAYEQPITLVEISQIRETDSSGVMETLLARATDRRWSSVANTNSAKSFCAVLSVPTLGVNRADDGCPARNPTSSWRYESNQAAGPPSLSAAVPLADATGRQRQKRRAAGAAETHIIHDQ
jgi:hypothetical protein